LYEGWKLFLIDGLFLLGNVVAYVEDLYNRCDLD